MSEFQLVVSPHPHIHSGQTVQKIMRDIVLALMPALLAGLYIFGLDALRVVLLTVLSAVGWEALLTLMTKKPLEIADGTAVASGLILAMLLPATLPWWIIFIATLIMIVLGKVAFGGYGSAPFNGVLIAWIVLQMSYPDFLFDWGTAGAGLAATAAPIQVLKTQGPAQVKALYSAGQLLIGPTVGSIGLGSMLMLILGGIYLMVRKVIDWRIPVSYLAGVFVFSGLFWIFNPGSYADPVFHLLAGGSIMAAFFLATDMPSTPVTKEGMIIFGLAAGILTVIIRTWGAWTFGAYFAVLMLNMATPFLDKLAPDVYGR